MKYTISFRKLKAEKLPTQESYDQYVRELLPCLICPNCKSPSLARHDRYSRHLYKDKDERITILVQRMKCRSCRKTFVILPESVFPYKRYILPSLITFISVVKEVSKSSCRRWFELNNSHLDYLLNQYSLVHEKWLKIWELTIPPDDFLSFSQDYHRLVGIKFMQIIPA